MRSIRLTALSILVAGCASAGGFPTAGDPDAAISNATRLIAEAEQAGAATSAADALAAARQHLSMAQTEQRGNSRDRAALHARQAAADATFARAQAERVQAEKAAADAQTALSALPPGDAR